MSVIMHFTRARDDQFSGIGVESVGEVIAALAGEDFGIGAGGKAQRCQKGQKKYTQKLLHRCYV